MDPYIDWALRDTFVVCHLNADFNRGKGPRLFAFQIVLRVTHIIFY